MKKVTAFFIALVLFLGTACGIHFFVDKNIKFDPHSFGAWINQHKFFAGDEIKANIDPNTILVLGSSEFRHGTGMSTHPVNLFKDNSMHMMMVGAGYYQSLFHSVELAAVEDGIKNKKVVLILSPQWFKKKGVLAPAYASRFSEDNFIAMLQNKHISKETKEYILKRSKKLLRGDPPTLERVEKYERIFMTGDASLADRQYVRFYRKFLAEKSKLSIYAAAKTNDVREYDPNKTDRTEEPDWNAYAVQAEAEGMKAVKDNPFYVDHRVYMKEILPELEKKKDSAIHSSYAKSPEYNDLRCFLKICQETGIEPMLVLQPVNGYWYDHLGFPKEEREIYYQKIRGLASEFGVRVADFSKEEYTRYFFIDKVHLGWKGWLDVNESIYDFATKTEKQ